MKYDDRNTSYFVGSYDLPLRDYHRESTPYPMHQINGDEDLHSKQYYGKNDHHTRSVVKNDY